LNLHKLLRVIPLVVIMTLVNVFICTTMAIVALLEFISISHNKWLSFIVALLIGVGTYTWIAFNHKIRNYIKENTT
jgi:hypothetical protein